MIILLFSMDTISSVVGFIRNVYTGSGKYNDVFISLLLKVTGIAILTEYAVSICKDSGETAIANKVDLGGKVIIVAISVPIVSALLETLINVLP